jgi:hypothetical protein
VRVLTNLAGTVVNTYAYSNTTVSSETIANP